MNINYISHLQNIFYIPVKEMQGLQQTIQEIYNIFLYITQEDPLEELYTEPLEKPLELPFIETTPLTQEPSVMPLQEQPSSKRLFEKVKLLHLGTHEPSGPFDLFTLPYGFISDCYAFAEALQHKSQESITDLKLKIINAPFQTIYSFFSLSNIIIEIGIIFKLISQGFVLFATGVFIAPAAGIVACVITGTLECKTILKVKKFYGNLNKSLALVKEDPKQARDSLKFLESYINAPEEAKVASLIKLSNRTIPWYAEKLEQELPKIIWKLEQTEDIHLQEEGLKEAISLQEEALIQTKKKLIEHSLCLLAITISLVAFTVLLIFQPYLLIIPSILMGIALVISLSNYIYASGVKEHSGWEFKAIEFLPSWIRKRLPCHKSEI